MRRFILFLFFISSLNSLAGDRNVLTDTGSYTSLYKLDLFRAFQGTIQLSREAKIKKHWTYNVAIMGTYASTRGLAKPYIQAQDFAYTDLSNNTTYSLDHVELLGYGINIQLRKYLGKEAPLFNGYYVSPEFFFRQLNLQSTVNDKATQVAIDINKTLFLGYLGYIVGYQKTIRDVVSFDCYAGGGFFYSQYAHDNRPTRYRTNYQIDYTGFYLNAGILIGITH